MQTPILGQAYMLRSPNAADNRLVNLYPEIIVEGGKQAAYLTRAPGLRRLATLGDGPVRGLWQTGNYGYAVSGNTFYRIDSSWNATAIGPVAGFGPVSMADNGLQIFIAANPYGYVYDIQANTIAQINDPDFPGAVTVGFIDGYFIFNEPNSQRFWITDLYQGENIDALDFASAEGSPDGLVAVAVDHREAWLFGTNSVEVWYDSGASDFPFERIQGAYNEIGCVAAYSVAKLDNGLFWLGADARGRGIVYRANGYTGQRISTHAVEWAIQQYSDISDAIGYTYQQDGHAFYVLIFPTARTTWVYDVATQAWHERAGWENGEFVRHRSNCQMSFADEIVVGDYNSGKIYAFDKSVYDDDGDIQKWLRSWRALPTGQNDLKRTAQHSLQLDVSTGTATVEDTASITPEPWPPAPGPPPPVGVDFWLASFSTDYYQTVNFAYDSSANPAMYFLSRVGSTYYSTTMLLDTTDAGIIWQNFCAQANNANFNSRSMATDIYDNVYANYDYADVINGVTVYTNAGAYLVQIANTVTSGGNTVRFLGVLIDSANNAIVPYTGQTSGLPYWFGFAKINMDDYTTSSVSYVLPNLVDPNPTTLNSHSLYKNASDYYAFAFSFNPSVYTPFKAVTVLKLDSSQSIVWAVRMEHSAQETAEQNSISTAIDDNGDVYVAYGIYLVGDTLLHRLAKLDGTDGSVVWAKNLDYGVVSVCVDAAGTLFALNSNGEIMAFDGSGDLLWCTRLMDASESFQPNRISVNEAGFLMVAGRMTTLFIGKLPYNGALTGGTYSINGHTVTYLSSTPAYSAVSIASTTTSFPDKTYTYNLSFATSDVSASSYTNVEVPL